jgi:adenine-specific DNA-methyltransferase
VDYKELTREQAVNLLIKRDAQRKLGLVWEREEVDSDAALNSDFVVMDLDGNGGSCGNAPYHNLIIEGDNFDALRWLRMTHAGQVKVIYIDPPYNTGNKDWVYNDNYVDPNDRFRHSKWLDWLYQRLTIARDLLAADGVIFVSINDENRAKPQRSPHFK